MKPKSAVSLFLECLAFLVCQLVFRWGLFTEGMDLSAPAEVPIREQCVLQARSPQSSRAFRQLNLQKQMLGYPAMVLVALVVTDFGHRRNRLEGERSIPGAAPLN